MKISKKVLGVAMSIAVLGSQAMTVLATDSKTDPAAGTTGGTANILDYKVETVVVPTTLKVALNPDGYDITMKYEKATAYAAGTVYYTESGGNYTKATVADATAFGSGGPYYTAVTSDDQVVSLNYGIANKSTADKTVKIDFAATYTSATGKKAIEFVDSAAKARAYNETSNADGAKRGEHKMYLAVASADAVPTTNTYKKTVDTTAGANKTYYTKGADGTYTAVSPAPTDFTSTTYYESTTDIGTEITAAELSDVNMTKATVGNQAFVVGTTNKADASIAYSLGAATYGLMDGAEIDFDTAQTDLNTKLEMQSIGGVAGFTLTGAVNADADWTEADAAAITITPTYTIENATGDEEDVDAGAYNQIALNVAPSATANISTLSADTDVIMSYSLGFGDDAAEAISSVTVKTSAGADGVLSGTDFCTINTNTKTVTISKAYAQALIDGNMTGATYTIVFDNDKTASCTVGTMN